MLRKTVSLAALAAVLSTSAATAAELQEVTIFDNDLMPPIVFAQPGDTVRFINQDEGSHKVWSTDNTWSTGEIPANTAVEFTVTEWMSLEYKLDEAYFLDYSGGDSQDPFDGVFEEGIDIADTNANGESDEGHIQLESGQSGG